MQILDLLFENLQLAQKEFEQTRGNTSDTIEVDGVLRSRTNSIGKPIAQTDQAIRNFWRWFGDSKVVDVDGKPLVAYHGTDVATFTKFRTPAFFTDDKEAALDRANTRQRGPERVEVVYLRITNDDLKNGSEISNWVVGGREFVVTNPEQIKSAAANVGTFDPSKPEIDS